MCSPTSQPSLPAGRGKRAERLEFQKTWSKERCERVHNTASSPVEISSGEESDSLPDLTPSPAKDDSTDSMLESKKERHFLDVIAGKIKGRRDRISAETQAGSGPTEPENVVVLRYPDLPPAKSKGSHFRTEISSGGKKRPLTDRCQSESEVDRKKVKNQRVKFLRSHIPIQTEEQKSCRDFPPEATMLLDAAKEEHVFDPLLFGHCLNLLEEFSLTRKPPMDIMKEVIKTGLFYQESVDIAVTTYNLVMSLWTKYPDLIDIDWQWMETSADVLWRNQGAHLSNKVTKRDGDPGLTQAHLYFKLQLHGLRHDLSQCVLADAKSVRGSLAAATLSAAHFPKIKKIINWISSCLPAAGRPQNGVRIQKRLCTSRVDESVGRTWLWSLQELLAMSILVSRDRIEVAKRVAGEVFQMYSYLPGLPEKKALLQTIQCPLLCFCLVRLVLENCCAETLPSTVFPENVHELAHLYFPALPPKGPMTSLTPPPSPSDEEDGAVNAEGNIYTAENCEELTLLIYFVTKSYITCRQKHLLKDLRQQVLKVPDQLSQEELNELKASCQDFQDHLNELTTDLSPGTMVYLHMLEALRDSS
ncbi:hypothetical protein BaRGS_00020022 [Batillaria attramentaria]|uniref:Uncharacterized protein n=1 Tax=Batillaria attramentaria TaxID=370345 RepID=A0ABD0KPJ4_9CAEN